MSLKTYRLPIAAIGAALILFSPLLLATVRWAVHPTASYRGTTFQLPFGWVVDPTGLPMTVEKPWPSLMLGSESSLTIRRLDGTATSRALLDAWPGLHPGSRSWTEQASPSSLRCSARLSPRRWGHSILECLPSDAGWSFLFLGQQNDFAAAEALMQNVLAAPAPAR